MNWERVLKFCRSRYYLHSSLIVDLRTEEMIVLRFGFTFDLHLKDRAAASSSMLCLIIASIELTRDPVTDVVILQLEGLTEEL